MRYFGPVVAFLVCIAFSVMVWLGNTESAKVGSQNPIPEPVLVIVVALVILVFLVLAIKTIESSNNQGS